MFLTLLLAATILTPMVQVPIVDPKTDALIHSALVAETERLDVKTFASRTR